DRRLSISSIAKRSGRNVNAQSETDDNDEGSDGVKNSDNDHGDRHCSGNPNIPRDHSKQGAFHHGHRQCDLESGLSSSRGIPRLPLRPPSSRNGKRTCPTEMIYDGGSDLFDLEQRSLGWPWTKLLAMAVDLRGAN